MPAFSDDPVHQHSAQGQKQHARPDKRGCDEEIVAFAHLEPCRFRKRDIGRQKHQREQRRDGNIQHLPDGFRQTLRRLRYQAFWKSHGRLSQKRGKDTKTS